MSFKVETKLEPINKDNAPTNEKAESCVQLQLEHLEVNLFFDGTWNSKFNSDRYNNASMEEKTNDPKFNPNSQLFGFKGEGSISFTRGPTGIDRMHRAFKSDCAHNIALYVDGSGTETPEDIKNADTFKGDNTWGAASGWNSTGVYAKLEKMLEQFKTTLDGYIQKNQTKPTEIIFNVYGFSRGAATARMFCYRIIKQRFEREITKYVKLKGIRVRLKFVGLFDTVSSIGFSHSNDVKSDGQGLDFIKDQEVTKIVHIAAMHEYRQKFNLTNIAVPVAKGYGLEFALPGCHTDIGDALGTKGEIRDEPDSTVDNKGKKKTQWYVTDRDDRKSAILLKGIKDKADPNGAVWSLNPIPALREASLAQQENDFADFKVVMDKFIERGWFQNRAQETEIFLDPDPNDLMTKEKYQQLKVDRLQISLDYPKVPTYIMLDLAKLYHAHYFDPVKLKEYSFEKSENPDELKNIYENLKQQVLLMDKQTNKLAITVLREDQTGQQPRINVIDNEVLRKRMYNRYLHWCSSRNVGMGDKIIKTNIAYIDHTVNEFYRKIVSG